MASFQTMQLDENRLYSAGEVNNLLTLIGENIRQEYANDMNTINKYIKTGKCLHCNTLTFKDRIDKVSDELCFGSFDQCNIDVCRKCYQKVGTFTGFFHTFGWKLYENPFKLVCPRFIS